jgi:hypothetical protein
LISAFTGALLSRGGGSRPAVDPDPDDAELGFPDDPAPPRTSRRDRPLQFLRAGVAAVNAAALLVTAGSIYFLIKSRDAEDKGTKLASRETLDAQYGSLEDRELQDPGLYLTLFEFHREGLTPDQWIEQSLSHVAPSVDFSDVRSTDDLDQIVWSHTPERPSAEVAAGIARLRQLDLHVEGYVNFLNNVAEYEDRGIITSDEAEVWYVIVHFPDFSCQPIVLHTFEFANDFDFLSRRLALELQEALEENPFCLEVARSFAPHILEPSWVP